MNQTDLKNRLDALQDALMTLYEKDPVDLSSQIEHYSLLRKEAVLQYYCRKEGYRQLGLQILPSLTVSEHNAKEAIKMVIILKSLSKSQFAGERWTLRDTSLELFNTAPKNCFKKDGYEVLVWFDHDPNNAYPYTNWNNIYYQGDNDVWYKTAGKVDLNGLYYEDYDNVKVYFVLFQEKADLYSKSGEWTVNFKNEQLSSSIASSTRRPIPLLSHETNRNGNGASRATTRNASPTSTALPISSYGGREESESEEGPSSTSRSPTGRRRRRRGGEQGESAARPQKRKRGGDAVPTAAEVGSNHRTVPSTGLSRLTRLQAEARDPQLILINGAANQLKCFRYRCYAKAKQNFIAMSTVWHWVNNEHKESSSKLLVAFDSDKQRDLFLVTTTLPKGCTYCFGQLDCF
ncbi:regulatory protein [human papillomavirus 137]|uniref:Regulatory protein E2 n=1 Tax=human papillomavirus 137 TaxID=1070410 RepID=I3P6M0_9PAPI|nr:regulatory protein [human papillomavirus 137]AEM24610.1 regulatory protein [human papillomavirus 137]